MSQEKKSCEHEKTPGFYSNWTGSFASKREISKCPFCPEESSPKLEDLSVNTTETKKLITLDSLNQRLLVIEGFLNL